MPMFAASLEGLLVFVVILLLSGVSNWLKRRQAEKEEAELQRTQPPRPAGPHPAPPPPPAERPALNWEEELRRLLSGESEPPSPPPVRRVEPPPPPVMAPPPLAPKPMVAAPAPRTAAPPTIDEDSDVTPLRLPAGTHFAPTAESLDSENAPEFELATMAESADAYRRASQLQAHTEARLQQILAQTSNAVPVEPRTTLRGRSPDVAQVVAQFRHPRTARQAILASVILNPPKALEPPTGR